MKSETPAGCGHRAQLPARVRHRLPAHPTEDQVQAEYERFWQTLDGRPIESLIDLPLMTDPELQAAMQVLSALLPAALLH